MADITYNDPLVTEDKLTEFYNDIKPFLGCPAYVTQEGDAEYYSTDEKIIGRWVNGKPLYQKTVAITIGNGVQSVVYSFPEANIEYLVDYSGYIYWTSAEILPIPWYSDGDWNISAKMSSNRDVVISTHGYNNKSGYITVIYTKTTDSATTTIEQKPTHYSTDEQVVGTWIDGKPVYQKVIQIDGLNITNYASIDLSTYIPNISDVVEESHTYYHNNMWAHDYYYTDSDRKSINVYILNGELKAEVIAKGAAVTKVRFIIKYTKSTD